MADRLKELLAKVLDWWNKFTAKQKTIIVSCAAVVIFTVALIIYTFSRTQYVEIMTCENTAEAAEVVEILNSAGVTHRESVDGRTIEVDESQQSVASLALGSAGYVPDTLDPNKYFSSSLGTTSSDRERMWQMYLQDYLALMFNSLNSVKSAYVEIHLPLQNGTLAAQQEEASAYIQLELSGTFTTANAQAMAMCAATALGNSNTAKITIMDKAGNLIFPNVEDENPTDTAATLEELRNQAETMVAAQVKRVFLATQHFQDADVVSHLALDFSAYEEKIKIYNAPEGTTEGLPTIREEYQSSGTGGVAGEPGTGSNDSDYPTYVYPNLSGGESSSSESHVEYLQNERERYVTTPAGGIIYENSSMSVALVRYREYYEDTVKRQGLLDGITWEDFKVLNGDDVRLEVDDDYYGMAANATGISRDRITIIAYEAPIFHDSEGWTESNTSNLLSIIMLLLIVGLLAFVVLRSMRAKKAEQEEVEEEEELSVESMLQSTMENDVMETIDVETKSDVRLMVEKFVDENPEAAASLLRNWLNEDWN